MSQKISKDEFGLICWYELSSLKSKFEKEGSLHKISNPKFDYFSDVEEIGKELYPKTYKRIINAVKTKDWVEFDSIIKELCEGKVPVIFVPVPQGDIDRDPKKCGKYALDVIFLPYELKPTTFKQRFGRLYMNSKPKGKKYKPNPTKAIFVVNCNYDDVIDEGAIEVEDIYDVAGALYETYLL